MSSRAVKVSESTYNYLKKKSREEGESIKNVLDEIASRENDPMDYAGAWKMDDSEAEKLKKELKEMWELWEM